MHRVFVVPTPLSSSSKSKSSYKEEEEEKICCPLFAYFFTACLLTTSFENPKWKMNATPFSVVPTCPLLSKAARRDETTRCLVVSRSSSFREVVSARRRCFCASLFALSSSFPLRLEERVRAARKRERERDARARMLESTQARKFRTKTKRRACFQSSMVDALCRASSPSCSRGVFLSRERPTDAREREGGNEGVFEVFVRVYIYNARKEESLRCVYCARACR